MPATYSGGKLFAFKQQMIYVNSIHKKPDK